MSLSDPTDNETPVFTQHEAYMIGFAVAHRFMDDPDIEEVSTFIDEIVPKVLSTSAG